MQVTHVADHISHAVLGGKETIEFGISTSAEFFNILSSTLYANKKLAVVRETLCNAWDAHIASGRTHIAVEVTLNKGKLTIKDSGPGIHHDQIGPVYGVYGNSTKKNDGEQTGGFGLGCKAPFSITNHFEVISCHDGVKTVYNLSKSSGKIGGKMGILPIVSLPTTESGITVAIPIDEREQSVFQQYVRQVTANGEMNLLLNGTRVDVLPFSQAKHDFLITTVRPLEATTRIFVRYGSVIYPVDLNQEYGKQYTSIIALLNKLKNGESYKIIFQAPAHSVSVTPSRETLSMEDHTIASLVQIFDNFLAFTSKGLEKECLRYIEQTITEHKNAQGYKELLSKKYKITSPSATKATHSNKYIYELPAIADYYMQETYPDYPNFRKKDLLMRIDALIRGSSFATGLLQTFAKEVERNYHPYTNSDWLHRRMLSPLMAEMRKNPLLSSDDLFIYDTTHKNVAQEWGRSGNLIKALDYRAIPLENYLPFLKNVVVIANRKSDLIDRINNFPDMEKVFFTPDHFFIYVPGRKANAIEAARELFKKRGMTVLDLTIRHSWDEAAKPKTEPKKRVVKVGWPCLSSTLVPNKNQLDIFRVIKTEPERMENPEYYINLSFSKNNPAEHFSGLTSMTCYNFVRQYGSRGVIVNDCRQATRMQEKGIPDLRDFMVKQVSLEIRTNPRLIEHYPHSCEVLEEGVLNKEFDGYVSSTSLRTLLEIPEIRDAFGLIDNRTEEDKRILSIWKDTQHYHFCRSSPEGKAANTLLESITPSPEGKAFCGLLGKSFMIPMLDLGHISRTLRIEYPFASPERTKIINLLISAIKG